MLCIAALSKVLVIMQAVKRSSCQAYGTTLADADCFMLFMPNATSRTLPDLHAMLSNHCVSLPLQLPQLRAEDWVVQLDEAVRGLGELDACLQHRIMQLARLDQHLQWHDIALNSVGATHS